MRSKSEKVNITEPVNSAYSNNNYIFLACGDDLEYLAEPMYKKYSTKFI